MIWPVLKKNWDISYILGNFRGDERISNLCTLPLLFYERKMFQGARGLALYAGIAQRNGLVPIIGNQRLGTQLRLNSENSKQIFPEKEWPASVLISRCMWLWAIYLFPQLVCIFCRRKIYGLTLGICKSLTYTWMWTLGLRPRSSFSGNT